MDNEQIINYVMKSPENTNAEVLRGMLNQIGNNGSGGVLMCTITEDVETGVKSLGKSYADLKAALQAGQMIFAKQETTDESLESTMIYIMAEIFIDSGIYGVAFYAGVSNSLEFEAESDTDELTYYTSGQ